MILPFLALAIQTTSQAAGNATEVTVKISTGTYHGLIDPKYPNTRQFRAIPYAQAPIGDLRWHPPVALPPTPNAQRFSKRFPPSCTQFVSAKTNFYNTDLTKGNLIYNGNQNDTSGLTGEATSEDCLFAAVWTPTTPPPPGGFPVLFFMTGGGLIMGGIDIPWQIPVSWVERSQSHIMVTINYRVDIFGFPSAPGLPEEHLNLGILDQRAALEWTRDNIADFGGNPKRITQWGRSAGASSVDIHAFAWRDDPIAAGLYMQSGTVNTGRPNPLYSNFSYVAAGVGCGSYTADPAAELACMRQVPATMIQNFVGQEMDRGTNLFFAAVTDNTYVFSDYQARNEAGLFARIPTMISATANEFSTLLFGTLAPWPDKIEDLERGPDQAQVTEINVQGWVCPTLNATNYRSQAGVPVYRMQYAGVFPNLNKYKWMGAYHASDIVIPFGTYNLLDHVAPTTDFEVEVSRTFQDHLLAFVKDPVSTLR